MINPPHISQNISQSTPTDMPWYVRLLMALSGLVAGVFLTSIISLLFGSLVDNVTASFSLAVAMSMLGFGLFYLADTRFNVHTLPVAHVFISSLGFAIAMAGQIYWVLSVILLELSDPHSAVVLLIIQIVLTLFMPNFMSRLISGFLALGCLLFLLDNYHAIEVSLGLLALFTTVLNLQSDEFIDYLPSKWRTPAKHISHPLAYACTLALLMISVYFISTKNAHRISFSDSSYLYHYPLAQGLLILASLYAVWLILRRYGIALRSQTALIISTAVIVIGLLSLYVSGLLATSLVIVIAFANRQKTLLGLGIFSLVSYIFWYYYQLDTSLLVKSASMLIVGLALLALRWGLVHRYFSFRPAQSLISQFSRNKFEGNKDDPN